MDEKTIKNQLIKHLNGGEAFLPIDKVIEKFEFDNVGERMYNLPYSPYEMFYHITFAQKDILKFCVSDEYKSHKWPDDYWPENEGPKDETEWENLKKSYFEDRDALIEIAKNEELLTVVKNGEDQTLLREVLLVIEHTAYHTGQLVIMARMIK